MVFLGALGLVLLTVVLGVGSVAGVIVMLVWFVWCVVSLMERVPACVRRVSGADRPWACGAPGGGVEDA